MSNVDQESPAIKPYHGNLQLSPERSAFRIGEDRVSRDSTQMLRPSAIDAQNDGYDMLIATKDVHLFNQ